MAPNGYAHFTPGQSYATGKGYLFLSWADFVFPDHAEFQSGARDQYDSNLGGPRVVLRQPGTYTLDFLIEFPTIPAGAHLSCQTLVGNSIRKIQLARTAGTAQHVVLVYPLSPEAAGAPDADRAVGLHCFVEGAPGKTAWTFYAVEISKN